MFGDEKRYYSYIALVKEGLCALRLIYDFPFT